MRIKKGMAYALPPGVRKPTLATDGREIRETPFRLYDRLKEAYRLLLEETFDGGDGVLECGDLGGGIHLNPHPNVMEANAHGAIHQTGLVAYLLAKHADDNLQPSAILDLYSRKENPDGESFFVDLKKAYTDLWINNRAHWENQPENRKVYDSRFEGAFGFNFTYGELLEMDFDTCLERFYATTKYTFGPYRDEAPHDLAEQHRFIASNYLNHTGIPSRPEEVLLIPDGFKKAYDAVTKALLGARNYFTGGITNQGHALLAPAGSYTTLQRALSLSGGELIPLDGDYASSIERILREGKKNARIIYVPSVGNPLGDVMSLDDMKKIAAAVLKYNILNPDDPIFVVADEVYNHTVLDPDIQSYSIASINYTDLDDPEVTSLVEGTEDPDWFGSMHNSTITITSTSKTFNGAQIRFSTLTTGYSELRETIEKIHQAGGSGEMPPQTELMGISCFAFTPQQWVNANNQIYTAHLRLVQKRFHAFTQKCTDEKPIVEVNNPEGAWFCVFKFKKDQLPEALQSSEMLMYWLANGEGKGKSGVALAPGALYGLEDNREFISDPSWQQHAPHDPTYLYMRATLAVAPEHLEEMLRRMEPRIQQLYQIQTGELDPPTQDQIVQDYEGTKLHENYRQGKAFRFFQKHGYPRNPREFKAEKLSPEDRAYLGRLYPQTRPGTVNVT